MTPTPVSPDDWSDIGAYRADLAPEADLAERLAKTEAMLGRALNLPSMVAVVGAGLSRPFGYPGWQELAREAIETANRELAARSLLDAPSAQRLDALHDRLERSGSSESTLMFVIGEVKRLLTRRGLPEQYSEFLRDQFAPRGHGFAPNPYVELRALEIQRYATTNYDVELEAALLGRTPDADALTWPGPPIEPEHGDLREVASIAQTEKFRVALATFSLARVRGSARYTVLHLHGRYDLPESLIATESDYQDWYLGDESSKHVFRESLELLFSSNPILFVGYGLGDEDLLRILRRFTHRNPAQKQSRPLFALMPFEKGDPKEHEVVYQYERYGIHVYPFRQPEGNDPTAWGEAHCESIRRLGALRERWREGWLRKPSIRTVRVTARPPRPYLHYFLDAETTRELGPERVRKQVDKLKEHCESDARVVVVLGKGGTGKSWAAKRLIDELRGSGRFDGLFFWSSYYTDDAFTGLDRALMYLDPERRFDGGRFKRFQQCLSDGSRHLLVIDGFERLLAVSPAPELGFPSTAGVARLLEAIRDRRNTSTVLLTSRLWPDAPEYRTPTNPPKWLRVERPDPMGPADLRSQHPFDSLDEVKLSALCAVLSGHPYGLVLAQHYLKLELRSGKPDPAGALIRDLGRRQSGSRNSMMIRQLIVRVEAEHEHAREALERLSLFMSPIGEPVVRDAVRTCLAASRSERDLDDEVDRVIETLVSTQLLFRVHAGEGESQEPAFTVHPTVRGYVFQELHGAQSDALPNFTLPGFTAGTAVLHPGKGRSVEVVRKQLDACLARAEQAANQGDIGAATAFLRAAFGLVRSRMESLTASRWTSYPEYLKTTFRLINLIRRLSRTGWSLVDSSDWRLVYADDAFLYADELAWIYNDIGLACCSEGNMVDAVAVWEQGYHINRVIEEEHGGQYVVQSLLHLGHTFLELGRLERALEYLLESERVNSRFLASEQDLHARIIGYRGLISHLQGDWRRAQGHYRDAIGILRTQDRNPRAMSFFLFHWANLLGALGQHDRAARILYESETLAAAGDYPDLLAFVTGARGTLLRRRRNAEGALREFYAALDQARAIGIRRLEADLLSELSRLACDLGDYDTARRRATESLEIANELGLGLRQTTGLHVLGLALLESGDVDLGVGYLREAAALAHRQRYRSRESEIVQFLRQRGLERFQAGPRDTKNQSQ